MTKAEARQRLLRLNEEHEGDRDGGYALVDSIRCVQGESGPDDRVALVEALGDLVLGQHPQLWGVALEALVQSGDRDQVAMLGEEINSPTRSGDWKDNLVLGLLRLGDRQFRELILAHVRESIESPRKLTIPIVAALCRIDREACLEMSSAFFERAHATGRASEVEGFIQVFAGNFTAVDDELLLELVRRVSGQRLDAGRWLAACFIDYLSKPWMIRRLGIERVKRLRDELLGRGGRGHAC